MWKIVILKYYPSKLTFLLKNRYTGKEVIANNTVVSKLLCHDLDEPPDMIHYAPSSGPVGSGRLFKQVPMAENCVQVSPSCCICREFSQEGGAISWPCLGAGRVSKRNSDTAESGLLRCFAWRPVGKSFLISLPILLLCQSLFGWYNCSFTQTSPHTSLQPEIWLRKPLITSLLLWS